MVELGQHKPGGQVVNGIDHSAAEWPIVGDSPPDCVDFGTIGERTRHVLTRGNPNPVAEVIVERDREETIRMVEGGSCEVLAHNSIHHPNWEIVVRWIERTAKPAIKPTLILAGGVAAVGVTAIGMYKLSKDPKVEHVAEEMRRRLRQRKPLP